MPYYVVNVGRGRSSTHIVKSRGSWAAEFGTTLCGLAATRHVEVFTLLRLPAVSAANAGSLPLMENEL